MLKAAVRILQTSDNTQIILPLIKYCVNRNFLLHLIDLIEHQTLFSNQNLVPLPFQHSISWICSDIRIICKSENRIFQSIQFFQSNIISESFSNIENDISDEESAVSVLSTLYFIMIPPTEDPSGH